MQISTMFRSTERVFEHCLPPLTMGLGARQRIPDILTLYGYRVFIITDPAVAAQVCFRK